MGMILPSASRWPRVMACPASHILPQDDSTSDAAALGTAVHQYIQGCLEVGPMKAFSRVPEFARRFCDALDLDALGIKDTRFGPEVQLFYNPMTGEAAPVEQFGLPPDAAEWIGGRADLIGVAAGHVYVGDFKTGHSRLGPVADNWQLRVNALAAARAYKRTRAKVEILYLRENGDTFRSSAEFGAFDLDLFAAEIQQRTLELREMAGHYADNPAGLRVSEGEHCRYCPAFNYCPAKKNLIIQLVEAPDETEMAIKACLTKENAPEAYRRYKNMKALLDRIGKAIYAYARETPIDLGDGMQLRETAVKRESIDADQAYSFFRERYGQDVADAAVGRKATKTALSEAVRLIGRPKGVTLKALRGEIEAELRAKGIIAAKESTTITEAKAEDD